MSADVEVREPVEADAEAIAAVCNQLSGELYGLADLGAEEVRHWFSFPSLGMAVAQRDGGLAGYADFRREEDGAHAQIDLRVRRGSGAADALLEAAEASLGGCLARCFVSERDDDAKEALARRGYRLIRHSFQMQIDLEARPEPPSWPRGFAVRTYGPEDEQAVYECQQEAFADHWDFRPTPLELWRKFSLERPSFDPTLWWLAESGGELAGICLGDWHASGDRAFGWIGSLAVRRQWRGQGLGLALLRHSFVEFAGRGATRVGLGVDAENTTGAVRLYERAGMRSVRRMETYESQL